jgi:Flp pilus assembly protein TadD
MQSLLALAAEQRADDAALQRRLAESLTQSGNPRSAQQAWRRVVQLVPEDGSAWLELGSVLLEAGQISEAVCVLNKACLLLPNLLQSRLVLARALRLLGDEAAADTEFDRAIAIAPDHPICIRAVGRRLARSGRGAELTDHCLAAGERVGWSVELLDHLVIADALQGRRAQVATMIDYRLLSSEQITVPPAPFASLSSSNAALAEELRGHPRMRLSGEHANEFVSGDLAVDVLDAGHSTIAISALSGIFKQAYAHYCTAIETQAHSHFRRLMPSRARVTVSGQITRKEGYVLPHTHSSSWLVGVYYVALQAAAEPDHAGCVEFGPPTQTLKLPDGIWPRLLFRPTPGTLLLFPGYFPHWSWPSQSDDDRIVMTFNVIPITSGEAL